MSTAHATLARLSVTFSLRENAHNALKKEHSSIRGSEREREGDEKKKEKWRTTSTGKKREKKEKESVNQEPKRAGE